METATNHMHKIKQGTKSTKVTPLDTVTNTNGTHTPDLKQYAPHDLRIHTIRTDTLEDAVSPHRLKELLATDLPGRFPVTLAWGHIYLFVMYDCDAKYIHVQHPSSPENQKKHFVCGSIQNIHTVRH